MACSEPSWYCYQKPKRWGPWAEGKTNKPPPGSPGWDWGGGVLWAIRIVLSPIPQGFGFSSRQCLTRYHDLLFPFPTFYVRSQYPRKPHGFAVVSPSPLPLLFLGNLCPEKQIMLSRVDDSGGHTSATCLCFRIILGSTLRNIHSSASPMT